jgi:hypothetical protein
MGFVTEHYDVTIVGSDDPASSVLDVNRKAHEVDNLYVVDTSVFPGIGMVNPALTAMAHRIPPPEARPTHSRTRTRRQVFAGSGTGHLIVPADGQTMTGRTRR